MTDLRKVAEFFGFLLAQEIAKSPITPKDTARMARSFPGTAKILDSPDGYVIQYNTPFYTEFVHEGTKKMKARPFVIQILNQKGEQLLKQAFRLASQ